MTAGETETALIQAQPAPVEEAPAAVKAPPADLSVVIPVLNEEERIVNNITLMVAYLSQQRFSYELIVSDDGSSDESMFLVADEFAGIDEVRIVHSPKHQGKGAAVRRGVLAARGEAVIFTDADLAYPVETVGQCVEALNDHDIVIGSRNLRQSNIEITTSLVRRLTGPVFKTLVRSITLQGFTDTQCGFKGFRRHAARKIFENCMVDGFAFDVEVLALAQHFGFTVKEIPVRLVADYSDSRINLTSDPFSMVLQLLEIRRRLGRLKREADD